MEQDFSKNVCEDKEVLYESFQKKNVEEEQSIKQQESSLQTKETERQKTANVSSKHSTTPSTSKDIRFAEPEVPIEESFKYLSIPSTSKTTADDIFKDFATPSTSKTKADDIEEEKSDEEALVNCYEYLTELLGEEPNNDISKKQFGFLGVGGMGQHMVKRLIDSGHYITVWDRKKNVTGILDKCDEFVKMGAKMAESPADVVSKCDITFCCLSNEYEVEQVVFGTDGITSGVLNGLTYSSQYHKKGFVVLTSISTDEAENLASKICRENCDYLQVAVVGTATDAQEGNLLFLVSGKQSLMNKCMSCFAVMGKDAFFLGTEIERALALKASLSMVVGPAIAAFREVISLMRHSGVDIDMFLEFLGACPLGCKAFIKQGQDIEKGDLKADVERTESVKEDLTMASILANEKNIPTQMASAALESFKRNGYFLEPKSKLYQNTCVKKHYISKRNINTSDKILKMRKNTLFRAKKSIIQAKKTLNQIQIKNAQNKGGN